MTLGETMSDQNIKIGLQVSSNGTTEAETKKALGLKAAYDAAASSATKIGGTGGSRAMAAKAAPAGSELAMQDRTYNQMRGSAGVTGASARDFANQAQGLGGLVRLYATYAANLFAVGAAFTALKNAADTTNLVKGLDQLGARSGVALGTLSKQLIEVTDGAISMREAMETVTKATSSGLSSKQVLELGKVAKVASQALGIGMEDAVSRLTRGITKLEPELLDELGIFTKIEPAVQKYAQSIGRAANSLTDFERRQAFALAVLEEGTKKFGDIELDANPYNKFLATLKDVSQSVLEVINKGIAPLIEYLSKSPTALLTVLGGIAAIIVRQALPAFGQLRKGLESAAEDARERALQRARDVEVAREKISQAVIASADKRVEAQVEKINIAEAKITAIKDGNIKKQSALYKVLQKDLDDVTERDIKRIEASGKQLETRGLKDQAQIYKDAAKGIRDYQSANTDYQKVLEEETKNREKSAKWWSIEGINRDRAAKANVEATRSSIVANAAYNGSLVGLTRSFILLNYEIAENGIKGWQRFTLTVRGGAAIIAGALATVGAAINKVLGVIGILTTIYSVLDSFLDGASESVGKFDSAVDKAKSSAENLNKTYKEIYKNDPFSAQSVQARGNALMDVADGFSEISNSANQAKKDIEGSWWARIKELATFGGTSRAFGKSIATQITTILKTIDSPEAKKRIESIAKEQLGITELSFDNIAAAARRAGAGSEQIKKLEDAIKGVATQAKIAGVASAQFEEAYKKVSDQLAQINQKFAVSDDIANFAINSSNALKALDEELSQGVTNSAAGLVKALEGIGKGANIFSTLGGELSLLAEDAKYFASEMSGAAKDTEALTKRLEDLNAKQLKRSDFTRKNKNGIEVNDPDAYNAAVRQLEADRRQAAQDIAAAQTRQESARVKLQAVSDKVQSQIPEALARNTELLGVRLAGQLAKGSTQFLQGVYASFDAVPELVAKSSQLKLREIDAQIANTKAIRDLTVATVLSAAQQKISNAQKGVEQAQDAGTAARDKAQADLATATREYELLDTAVRKPQQALAMLAEEERNATDIGKRLGGTVKDLAARTVEFNVALQNQNQQRLSEQLQGQLATNNARLKQEQNLLKLKQDDIKIEGERLQLQISQEGIGLDAKQQLTNQIAINREKQIELDYQQRIGEAAKEFADQAIRASALTAAEFREQAPRIAKEFQDKEALAAQQRSQSLEQVRLNTLKQQSDISVERINREETAYKNRQALDKVALDSALELKQIRLETEQAVEAAQLQNLNLSAGAKSVIDYQATLRLAGLEAERKKIQANAEFERQSAENTFAIRKVLAKDTGEDGLTQDTQRQIQDILAQEQAQKATRDAAVKSADAQYNKAVQIAGATKQAALEQQAYNDQLQLAADISASLQGAFEGATGALGQFGQNLGSVIDALARVGELNDKNAKTSAALDQKRTAAIETFGLKSKEVAEIDEQISAQNKKSVRDEVTGYAQIAGSAKKMFKEKTVAYKLLDATEKAMHLWRMASAIREMVMEKAGTAVSLAESAKKIGAKVVEAGTDGVAAVVKAISAFPPPFNFIAGAATAAAVGMLLSQIGAKSPKAPAGFGAETAQKVQGTGQAYDASGNIVTRSGGVTGDPTERADSIVSSIEILNTNVFNMLGSKSSTIAKLLAGIKDNTAVFALSLRGRLPGYANMLAPEQVSDTTGTMSTLGLGLGGAAGFKLGGFFGGPFGALVGGALGALAGALFGTKTTRSVEDSGINISGTAGGLGRGVGTFENYANIKTTKKSFFGGTRVSYAMQAEQMAQDSINAASRIITGINDALVLAGDALEGSGTRVVSLLDQIPIQIKVSAKGLSAKEYAEAVTSEISVQLNSAAEQVFPYLVQYNKIGEEMYETVSRIVSEGESLSYGLKMIGGAITETDAAAKVAKQQDLINYLGGIKEAGDSINYYFENFISAEEQYRFNLGRLTTAFSDASLTLPKTKKEFSALVDSVKNVDSDQARQTLGTLLTYSEDFDKLLSASNDLRGEELKSLEDSASKLRDYAKSLREFNSSLVTGSLSIATPLEKFAQLQAEFTSASGLAKTGDLAALGKLQGLSQDLLTSGKELWASGPKYAELFGTVTATLADVANFADAKADVQELQLTALKDTVSLLSNIDANMAALAGGNALQTAATGGYRSGLTLVGELGPELVDFQTPGRVYTADQTAGMFAQAPNGQQFNLVVAELQQLRQEVATLRKDQQRQTGDLIVTNYDATNKLAEQITDAVVQTVTDSSWQNRSKPQIK